MPRPLRVGRIVWARTRPGPQRRPVNRRATTRRRVMFENRKLRFDLLAIAIAAVTAFLGVSLLSHDAADPIADHVGPVALIYQPDVVVYPQNERIMNACGRWGALAADLLLTSLGAGAFYAVASLGILSLTLLRTHDVD